MFLFEQMFNTTLSGIASAGLMSVVFTAAYGILLASLLFSAYEAWTRGGDVRSLGTSAIKYLALGALFLNDGAVYQSVFQSVVAAFNSIAHAMAGVGPIDVFGGWLAELRNAAAGSATLLNIVTGATAGVLSAVLLLIAMVLFPVAYMVFAILYALFGTILYVTGPLVLALLPTLGVGTLARRYAINVMIFASWGLIYGIFCRLAMALNINSMAAITNAGSFAGALTAASAEVLLAVASILFSVCILLIPFLAKRIVEGDIGSSMLTVLGTAAAAGQTMMSLVTGSTDGFGSTSAAMGGSRGSSGGSSGGGSGSSSTSPAGPSGEGSSSQQGNSAASGGKAPSGPSGGHRSPGQYRTPNVPHGLGWLAGAAAAISVHGGHKAAQAAANLGSKMRAQSETKSE
jgi:hypothetical protein